MLPPATTQPTGYAARPTSLSESRNERRSESRNERVGVGMSAGVRAGKRVRAGKSKAGAPKSVMLIQVDETGFDWGHPCEALATSAFQINPTLDRDLNLSLNTKLTLPNPNP